MGRPSARLRGTWHVPGSRWAAVALVILLAGVVPSGLAGHAATSPSATTSSTGTRPGPSPASLPPVDPLGPNLSWTVLPGNPVFLGSGGGLAAVPGSDLAVAFGGDDGAGLQSSTYLYNESNNTWDAQNLSFGPSARSDFALSYAPGAGTLLFGGRTGATNGSVASDLWNFSTSEGWFEIHRLPTPAPRQDPAFAVGDGIALLYGGWDQDYNGLGAITFGDTWALNLTNRTWSELAPYGGRSPGPLRGASMLYDPVDDEFLLFGGCYPCESTVWAYSPANNTWSPVAASGPTPPAAMGSTWVWDTTLGDALLFGGTNGTGANAVTSEFFPETRTWYRLPAGPAPTARAWASATYLSDPGNDTLLLVGGSNATGTYETDAWRLAEEANVTVEVTDSATARPIDNATVTILGQPSGATNPAGILDLLGLPATETSFDVTAAGYAAAHVHEWLSPGSTSDLAIPLRPLGVSPVDVYVSSLAGAPLAHAFVNLTEGPYRVGGSPRLTNGSGWAVFPAVPTAVAEVTANAVGYHHDSSGLNVTPNATATTFLILAPLLTVDFGVTGLLPNGSVVPLRSTLSASVVHFGVTDLEGWLNTTTTITGRYNVTAASYGFAPESMFITFGYTGKIVQQFRLTAAAFPTVTVTVSQAGPRGTTLAVPAALVNLSSSAPVATGWFNQTYGASLGTVQLSPPPGNYTFTAWAPGFDANRTPAPIFLLPGRPYALTLELTPLPLSSLHVVVLSVLSPEPAVAAANVTLRFVDPNRTTGLAVPVAWTLVTSASGWANFSGLPGAEITLNASAPGFYPSSSVVSLPYNRTIDRFTIDLTPMPPSPASPGSRGPGVRLFPASAVELWPLLVVPAAGLIGAALYLTMIRTPAPAPVPDSSRPAPRRTEPDPSPPDE